MSTVGIDVGGTHTDVVLVGDAGELLWADKVASNPQQPLNAIREALRRLPADSKVELCVNGTTVGINALIQRTLPRVGLIATQGFPDLLYIRRETKANIYDFNWRKPLPLISRRLTYEVEERMGAMGEVVAPIGDLAPMVEWVRGEGLEDLAVCLLHSYRNPSHERQIRAVLEQELPEVRVTLSSDVWPEWREFERTYNTALNAALKPVMSAYVRDLLLAVEEALGHDKVRLMHADAGILGTEEIAERPVLTLLSGTVAGALAGAHFAARTGHEHAVSLDMGGTSTDLSLSEHGVVRRSGDLAIEWEGTLGFAGIDVVSIGAGGGSIVWCDEAGGVHVGPRSAGADPGPAAIERGGQEPTLTDAYLLLGYLGPEPVIGGRTLNRASAERAFARITEVAGVEADRAYLGAFEIATAHLVSGIRRTTIERGVDPRTCAVVCFGGAGPLHAAQLLRGGGLAQAIIPPRPGNGSAFGLLLAPVKHSVSRTYYVPLDEIDRDSFATLTEELRRRALAGLPDDSSPELVELEWRLSLRYRGQTRELTLLVGDRELTGATAATFAEIAARFHQRHEDEYTFLAADEPIDLVSVRCDVTIASSTDRGFGRLAVARTERVGPYAPVKCTFPDDDGNPQQLDTAVVARDELEPDAELRGPVIVLDVGSTVLVPPGFVVRADREANLLISEEAEHAPSHR
jgi:N-methylhydantoinase A